MRWFLWASLLFVSCQVVAAEAESFASLSMGYRLDALDWNINGAGNSPGSEPNILSELEWRDMDIFQLKAELVGANKAGFYFRGSAAYGRTFDGVNQDSDYAGDNRSLEFSRSLSDIDGSSVTDLSAGLGYVFYLGVNEDIRFIPLLGVSYNRQDLRMSNGNQILWDSANAAVYDPSSVGSPLLGPFPGLDASYDANWWGSWAGVDVLMDLQDGSNVYARVELHQAFYLARANWNLRDDFAHPVSFEHKADGMGWVLELGWRQPPSRYFWTWGATVSLQSWATDSGTDRTYLANNTYVEGRLNEVNWSSRSINLILSKVFTD